MLTYRKAGIKDVFLLISLYNSAFYEDYIHYGKCPGYGKSKKEMETSISTFSKYIISCQSTPVGVISFKNQGDGSYYLGCLCVIPLYQKKGIGTHAFQYMLSLCSDWKRITLITPVDKKENLNFYTQKCGFKKGNKRMDQEIEVVEFFVKR